LLSPPFDQADRPLQRGVSIGAVFRQVQGQLLVLGDPGAGKTTYLYELAQALVFAASRVADEPIPVILSLASWAVHRQDLTAWLAGELYRRYRVPRLVGQYWLRGRQVVLLLDGLDEVRAEHREACLRAINRFLDDPGAAGLVVCCRAAEYEALPVKLRLEGAVVIQPLTWVELLASGLSGTRTTAPAVSGAAKAVVLASAAIEPAAAGTSQRAKEDFQVTVMPLASSLIRPGTSSVRHARILNIHSTPWSRQPATTHQWQRSTTPMYPTDAVRQAPHQGHTPRSR
jgi:hypothetical protein